ARMVGKLHAAGILVGDLALDNLAVSPSGRVVLLDCDSFLIKADGRRFGGTTWRQDNSPPEGGSGRHTRETDYFSLAVAICQLLLEEFHPFFGIDISIDSEDERGPAVNITRGRSWLFCPDIRTPPTCPDPYLLPSHLRELARAAFEKGANNPAARPDAQAWYQGLVQIAQGLRHCGSSPQHVLYPDEWDWCPWCMRKHLQGGKDPFPAPQFAPAAPAWLKALPAAGATVPSSAAQAPAADSGNRNDAGQTSEGEEKRDRTGTRPERRYTWASLQEIYDADGTVTGTATAVVKGGLRIGLGVRGFLPASLVNIGPAGDLKAYIGREITAKIIHLDEARRSVVLSRRAWLEENASLSNDDRPSPAPLRAGQIVRGRVAELKSSGALVDLDGVEGLVPLKELSWNRISHPRDVIQIGQEITVEVLSADTDQQHVELSLKSTQEDPLVKFARTHLLGEVVSGWVKKLQPYGAFVDLGDVDGMIHISELSWGTVNHPSDVVTVGEEVMVRILDIEVDRRRIRLSLRLALAELAVRVGRAKAAGLAVGAGERCGRRVSRDGSVTSEKRQWLGRPESPRKTRNRELMKLITEIDAESRGAYGWPPQVTGPIGRHLATGSCAARILDCVAELRSHLRPGVNAGWLAGWCSRSSTCWFAGYWGSR
ncbi:MAG: S1 RNA-binding domain-containing protein, partial [Gemmataceae bacterium]